MIECSWKDVKKKEWFECDRGGFLMLEWDTQSNLHRKSMEIEQEDVCTVKNAGNNFLLVDNVPCDRGIKELVRTIDSCGVMLFNAQHCMT